MGRSVAYRARGLTPGGAGAVCWCPVSRAIDTLAILLVLVAAGSFGMGLHALGQHEDFRAVYMLVIGALALRASTEILRPRGGAA